MDRFAFLDVGADWLGFLNSETILELAFFNVKFFDADISFIRLFLDVFNGEMRN